MESSGICVGVGMRLSNVEHINIHTPIEKNIQIVVATILIINNVSRRK
jgi:hypothetical protein